MSDYRRNHYVPIWYQKRFIPDDGREHKFHYLDLNPARGSSAGRSYVRSARLRWGPKRCFCEKDLYTTRFGVIESTEIEEKFFGEIDREGQRAVEYFSKFAHPAVDGQALQNAMLYMSIQKLRTPKGLSNLARTVGIQNKNEALFAMQGLQQMFCAIWTESVWSIADATASSTKFIVSDHPVTVYNRACFPASEWCRGSNDPEVTLSGTHTIFPLDLERVLILTNLSWARDPYQSPVKPRPNPNLFRSAMFNFQDIQTKRSLTAEEVTEINFIIKQRARRYIAAAEEDWLYPERVVGTRRWDRLGDGYLLMPDPRSMTFSAEIMWGGPKGVYGSVDEYGRKPGHPDYKNEERRSSEWRTFQAFRGEFARIFGPRRRGIAGGLLGDAVEEDPPEHHARHLQYESLYKPRNANRHRNPKPRRT